MVSPPSSGATQLTSALPSSAVTATLVGIPGAGCATAVSDAIVATTTASATGNDAWRNHRDSGMHAPKAPCPGHEDAVSVDYRRRDSTARRAGREPRLGPVRGHATYAFARKLEPRFVPPREGSNRQQRQIR